MEKGREVVQTKGERGRTITISPLNVYHAVCGVVVVRREKLLAREIPLYLARKKTVCVC